MAITQELINLEISFEGNIPSMYLDSNSNVTVGIGHLLATSQAAVALPFVRKVDGAAASDQEKTDEWTLISQQDPGHAASFYDQFCKLRMNNDDVLSLLQNELQATETSLEGAFTDYDTYPVKAQEGLIDMAYNLGLNGVLTKFPTFTQAVRNKDWNTAAAQCHRVGIQDARNQAVMQLFLDAASSTSPVPVVSSIDPNSGPEAGGTPVIITGTGFTGATGVGFGVTGSVEVSVDSDTQIQATSPPGQGTVDITIVTPGGTSATVAADQFIYLPSS